MTPVKSFIEEDNDQSSFFNQSHFHLQQHTPVPDFINHELSANLDSTNAFEGPEKLLEIWFYPNADQLPSECPPSGLREIPVSKIEELLDLVNCKILSKKSSMELDAYLLSESSLFVFPHKMILKTCGTTTTLFCLSKLLELVTEYCNYEFSTLENIHRIFYSRRSFMFPQRQNQIHQSWSNELNWLNKYFPPSTSKAYIVGDLSNDHWYYYLNGRDDSFRSTINGYPLSPARSRLSSLSHSSIGSNDDPNAEIDQTFEMLMTELDPVQSSQFQLSKHQNEFPYMDPETEDYGHLLGNKMMKSSGLDSVISKKFIKSEKHDSFAFSPCGFSSNSIINEKFYYTLHITPEVGWSYASFETNLPNCDRYQLMNNVLNILKPGKFCLVHTEESDINGEFSKCFKNLVDCEVDGYDRFDKIVYDLKFGYKLLYSFYQKC